MVIGVRGILYCWMSQSDNLEVFKKKQEPINALHSKFALKTGDVIFSVDEFNHLQIDVVSFFLLFLVQGCDLQRSDG